jgi:transposase-like protein
MVAEYDAAPHGEKGAVLRRERLYDSHITEWRAAIDAGTLEAPPKRGRPKGSKGASRSPEQARIAELERDNAKLRAELERKDGVIAAKADALEVLGKGVAFLEALSSRNAR